MLEMSIPPFAGAARVQTLSRSGGQRAMDEVSSARLQAEEHNE